MSLCPREVIYSVKKFLKEKVKSTLFVTYTAYSEIWSLQLTHPWGAVGSHSAVTDSRLWAVLRSKVLTCFWWWGKLEHWEETHTNMGRTCKLHAERTCPSQESNPWSCCHEATVLTTVPPDSLGKLPLQRAVVMEHSWTVVSWRQWFNSKLQQSKQWF